MVSKQEGMPKWVVPTIVVVVLVLAILGWIAGTYNSLVVLDVDVETKWGQVQTVYQRRADLIPNLVATVQGSANFESSTQTKIAELRTQAATIKNEIQNAKTPGEIDAAAAKLQEVVQGYRSLNINVENYPDLKSNANFLSLQDELANSENKIAVERQRYNDAVSTYNKRVRSFPTILIAGMLGFDRKAFFEASEGSENAPVVNFE